MVAPKVEKTGMQFPILMTEGEDVERYYGVRGFPTSLLIDAHGVVRWKGHPGALEETGDLLERLLEETSSLPALSEEHASIGKLLAKRDYGKAYGALGRALRSDPEDAELKAVRDALEQRVKTRLEAARADIEAGEFGRASGALEELDEHWDGVPGAEQAGDELRALERNGQAKDELAAWTSYAKAVEDWREGELEKGLKALKSVARKYPDTPTGKRAAEIADRHG